MTEIVDWDVKHQHKDSKPNTHSEYQIKLDDNSRPTTLRVVQCADPESLSEGVQLHVRRFFPFFRGRWDPNRYHYKQRAIIDPPAKRH